MRDYRDRRGSPSGPGSAREAPVPGKHTLAERIVQRKPSGQPVDPGVRARFEATTGADVGDVRVHADEDAGRDAGALSAHAFASGADIFFAPGRYQPGTADGDRLIAHELTHTVQQAGGGAAVQAKAAVSEPGDAAEREADAVADAVVAGATGVAIRQPASGILRQATGNPAPAATPSPDDIKKRDDRVKDHLKEQKRVYALIDKGLKRKPGKGGVLDRDTLFRNACEWIATGKATLTVFTATHDRTTRVKDKEAFFDSRFHYPDPGGSYEPLPTAGEAGIKAVPKDWLGGMSNHRLDMFDTGSMPNDEDLVDTIIHEVQHDADLTDARTGYGAGPGAAPRPADAKNDDLVIVGHITGYQTEFRARWIEQLGEADDPYPSSTKAATNAKKVAFAGAGDPQTTHFKNLRQEKIFWSIAKKYEFEEPYVKYEAFRTAVDDFAQPAGMNVINSVRILALTEAIDACTAAKQVKDPEVAAVLTAAQALDAADRQFLHDADLSAPFWSHAKSHLGAAPLKELETAAAPKGKSKAP